ncbi:glycosyltransferase [Coriobacteriia bacterium Es71-Z0120]|uniref:glycosyltransferase n=1 Tax=Parvivirga hydrogeniphila TaxID=2939460 RepID=UPI002260F9EA|nr:glycosyltransferase [Parvivirga hydrogeniphila]MCL4079343.1 glycosyltransferase [Parvivirga hydrogeniphila]
MKVLFLENLPYESDVRVGSHHYAARFAREGHDVLWLSHPISPLHFVRRVKRDLAVRVRAWREGPLQVDGLAWYAPLVALPPADAPLLKSRCVYEGVARLSVPPLSSVLAKAGFASCDVVWLTNPYYAAFARAVHARCRVVRVADESSAFKGVSPVVAQAEADAIRDADVAFAVSAPTLERVRALRPDAVGLPNGVEFEHFARGGDEPPEYAQAPRPRVVYVGATEYWFDADLVAACARAMPHAAFFIIGPASSRVAAVLGSVPNVRLLGPRRYAYLPRYLAHADLGIVPFVRDEMIDAVHPIKVYEYLAAGLPVVATRWTELERMNAPVRLVDRSGFCQAVFEELASPSCPRDARIAYAAANSWDERFAAVKEAVEAVIGTARA